jgi:hypothetical protein
MAPRLDWLTEVLTVPLTDWLTDTRIMLTVYYTMTEHD